MLNGTFSLIRMRCILVVLILRPVFHMHGMSKNLINRSVQNVIIWNFIFSSRPKIDSILSSAHNKNLQCDKYLHAFCCLKMKMKLWKIIVVQDFWILKNQTLESQICLSVFQKKEESYLLKLYTK